MLWAFNGPVGFIVGILVVMVAEQITSDDWKELGEATTPNMITGGVLIGGTFLVIAQAFPG